MSIRSPHGKRFLLPHPFTRSKEPTRTRHNASSTLDGMRPALSRRARLWSRECSTLPPTFTAWTRRRRVIPRMRAIETSMRAAENGRCTPRDRGLSPAASIWHLLPKIPILHTFPDQEAPVTDRRTFVGSLIGASVALPGLKLPRMRADAFKHLARAQSLEDDAYWAEIQRAFDLDRTMVNLNNGGCSPAPTHVLEQMIRDLRFSNELPVEHMWSVLEPRIESVRRELARDFGCDPEEMAITRNASESNETMILGLDLKRGDEVIFTTQNYPRMQTTWRQRERRDGIVIKAVRSEERRV